MKKILTILNIFLIVFVFLQGCGSPSSDKEDAKAKLGESASDFEVRQNKYEGENMPLAPKLLEKEKTYQSLDEAEKNPEQVFKLDLSNQNLKVFPKEVLTFKNLHVLNLSGNMIEAIPEEISQLTYLCRLHLDSAQLLKIPPAIGQLSHLKVLSLANNQIDTVPPEIGRLAHLRRLDLSHNRIRELPVEISNLRSLKTLELKGNQLERLSVEIEALKQLEELEVGDEHQLSDYEREQIQKQHPDANIKIGRPPINNSPE